MRKDTLLVVLTAIGSALCWWPFCIWPNLYLHLPWWSALVVVALLTVYSTILSGGLWLRFVAASVAGSLVGFFAGFAIWPLEDRIAQSYSLLLIAPVAVSTVVVSLVAGLVGKMLSAP